VRVAITGSSKGIGKATREKLLSVGYEVVSINRPEYDLNDIEKVKSINLQNIDVLINNAGHDLGLGEPFNTMNKNDIISQVSVNLLSPMLLTHSFITQNNKGTVINITSGCINDLTQNMATYYTSKSGLSCFTKAVSTDLKDKFRFVEVIPRRIDTSFYETSKTKCKRNSEFLIPAKEVAEIIYTIITNPYINNITIKDPRR
jgi:short-subunit dehydrogenase